MACIYFICPIITTCLKCSYKKMTPMRSPPPSIITQYSYVDPGHIYKANLHYCLMSKVASSREIGHHRALCRMLVLWVGVVCKWYNCDLSLVHLEVVDVEDVRHWYMLVRVCGSKPHVDLMRLFAMCNQLKYFHSSEKHTKYTFMHDLSVIWVVLPNWVFQLWDNSFDRGGHGFGGS